MNLAAGLGSVTAKGVTLSSTYHTHKVAATRHCNGNDVWVMFQEEGNQNYRAYLLTAAGVNTVPVISTLGGIKTDWGYMKFSPSGKRLVSGSSTYSLELCDFNRSTGVVSNPKYVSVFNRTLGGVEFSPDETKLYGAGLFNKEIFQWDLCAGTASLINASQYSVVASGANKGALQLAPNGKIYVTRLGNQVLGVINSPNNSGAGCNYVELGQSISPRSADHALPNFLSSYFFPPQASGQFTNTFNQSASCFTYTFVAAPTQSLNCAAAGYSLTGLQWNFGDPSSGALNSSTLNAPVHVFTSSGTYLVKLVYLYSCGADTLKQTVQVNGPNLNINSQAASCALPGSSTINAIGGIGSYNYTWTPSLQNNSIAVGLTPGTYTVDVYDIGAGCLTTATTNIQSNYIFTSAISGANLLCNGVNTGSAHIMIFGGTGTYSYTWNGGQNTSSITGLSPGIYTVSVADINGPCTLTNSVQIFQPPPVILNVSANSLTNCIGGITTMTAVASGGSGGYQYTWINGPNSAQHSSAEQIPGTYSFSVDVVDANNCPASNSITLTFISSPVLSINTESICPGYTASLNVSGATSYTWNPSGFVGSNFTVSPSNTTYYTVTAFSTGCTALSTVTTAVHVVPPPSLTINLSSPSLCAQAFNGSPNTITLTSSGANTYTLLTSAPVLNPDPTNTTVPIGTNPPYYPTGISTATLLGSNGVCTVSITTTFSIIPNPTVGINSFSPVICAGETYTYTVFGAQSYTWSSSTPGSTLFTSGNIAVADPTINSVFSVIGSSLGCFSPYRTTTITVHPLPELTVAPKSPSVCAGNVIDLEAKGADTYYWTGTNGYTGVNALANFSAPGSPGVVTLTVVGTAITSCSAMTTLSLHVWDLPVASMNVLPKTRICLNEELTFKGFGAKDYKWNGPNDLFYAGQTISFQANSMAHSGNYTLTAIDENKCRGYVTKEIIVDNLPLGILTGQKEGCVPFCGDFGFAAVNGSDNIPVEWTVRGLREPQAPIQLSKYFNYCFTDADQYIITGKFTDTVTTCINTQTFSIDVFEKPKADFSWLPEKPVEGLENVIFTNETKGEGQSTWSWFFTNEKTEGETAGYFFREAGDYPVAMVVENKWGCIDTAVKYIKIGNEFYIYIPNAFTPNDDYLNDVFIPVMRGVRKYRLDIFDRWGENIFSTEDQTVAWDGSFRGEPCKQDVYVWKIWMAAVDGNEEVRTGEVVLYR